MTQLSVSPPPGQKQRGCVMLNVENSRSTFKSDSQRTDKSLTSAPKGPPKGFVRLNRNFCNYPLTRDRRKVRIPWRRYKDGRCFLDLPSCEDGVRVRHIFPHDVDQRLIRCPTKFDFNVLLLLTAEARLRKDRVVTFASGSAFLRRLDRDAMDSRYRQLLSGAI